MKLLKNTIAIIITAGFISSCIPHPGRRPMPPGHDKKVEKLDNQAKQKGFEAVMDKRDVKNFKKILKYKVK